MPLQKNKEWEWFCHLSSDHHWDSMKCRRDLLREHLDLAMERNAAMIFVGDQYDLMEGKFDKRSSKNSLRPEFKSDRYLDDVIEHSVKWYAPYAKNIAVVAEGNHDSAIRTRYETDMIQRFIGLLNATTSRSVYCGGYTGWVRFSFTLNVSTRSQPMIQDTVTLHYSHGWGGGGQVTHDAIQHQRRQTYLPDADVVVSGHTHDFWSKDIARVRLTNDGRVYTDSQLHLKIPSFKCDYGDGYGGWCVERGHAPKVQGSWMLRFYWSTRESRVMYEPVALK